MPVELIVTVPADIHQVVGIQCNFGLVNIHAVQHDFVMDDKAGIFMADLAQTAVRLYPVRNVRTPAGLPFF